MEPTKIPMAVIIPAHNEDSEGLQRYLKILKSMRTFILNSPALRESHHDLQVRHRGTGFFIRSNPNSSFLIENGIISYFMDDSCPFNFLLKSIENRQEISIENLMSPISKLVKNDISSQLHSKYFREIPQKIIDYIADIKKFLAHVKKLMAAMVRLQFVAYQIHNTVSSSPTPQKKEPPVGGIKVGGEQAGSHVAGELYPLSFHTLKHATRL